MSLDNWVLFSRDEMVENILVPTDIAPMRTVRRLKTISNFVPAEHGHDFVIYLYHTHANTHVVPIYAQIRLAK